MKDLNIEVFYLEKLVVEVLWEVNNKEFFLMKMIKEFN